MVLREQARQSGRFLCLEGETRATSIDTIAQLEGMPIIFFSQHEHRAVAVAVAIREANSYKSGISVGIYWAVGLLVLVRRKEGTCSYLRRYIRSTVRRYEHVQYTTTYFTY